jgi:hypothetical protein
MPKLLFGDKVDSIIASPPPAAGVVESGGIIKPTQLVGTGEAAGSATRPGGIDPITQLEQEQHPVVLREGETEPMLVIGRRITRLAAEEGCFRVERFVRRESQSHTRRGQRENGRLQVLA